MKYISLAGVALLAFVGTAFAANTVDPTVGDPGLLELAKPIYDAIMHGNGWLAASLAIVLLVAMVKKWLAPRWPWLAGDVGGPLLVLFGSFGGALGTALMAGAGMSPALALVALKIALAAGGGYAMLKKLVAPLLRSLRKKVPAWMRPGFDLVLWIFDRPGSAKLAGDAAVVANPPSGVEGIVGKPDDIP